MDHIREALEKAHLSLDGVSDARRATTARVGDIAPKPAALWSPPTIELDPRVLSENRIVAHSMSDNAHAAFNVLRTRVRSVLGERKWKSIAVTSPTPGCGKTLVAINLAISMARGSGLKTVLVDFDLRRPAIARALGIKRNGPWMSDVLRGDAAASQCFVEVGNNLVVGLGGGPSSLDSSELLSGPSATDVIKFVTEALQPDVLIFDLPPMGISDDALAFLPKVDSTLLIAAAGQSSISQIDECERAIAEQDKLLGVVLNKVPIADRNNYYY